MVGHDFRAVERRVWRVLVLEEGSSLLEEVSTSSRVDVNVDVGIPRVEVVRVVVGRM